MMTKDLAIVLTLKNGACVTFSTHSSYQEAESRYRDLLVKYFELDDDRKIYETISLVAQAK
jgi:hypothetical protein